jgi:hypothetical protein
MDHGEIEAVRALLSSKPRPVGWAERRQRIVLLLMPNARNAWQAQQRRQPSP